MRTFPKKSVDLLSMLPTTQSIDFITYGSPHNRNQLTGALNTGRRVPVSLEPTVSANIRGLNTPIPT